MRRNHMYNTHFKPLELNDSISLVSLAIKLLVHLMSHKLWLAIIRLEQLMIRYVIIWPIWNGPFPIIRYKLDMVSRIHWVWIRFVYTVWGCIKWTWHRLNFRLDSNWAKFWIFDSINENSNSVIPIRISKSGSRLNKSPNESSV